MMKVSKPSPSTPADSLPKVLAVDDTPANLLAMRAILSKLPIELMTASSGPEALSLMLRHEFALVLLDVNMPDMNGYETAELIRDHTVRDPVPVIFVTAHDAGSRQVFKGYESGAIDYLFKPLDEVLLTSKVRVLLDLYVHRRRLQESSHALALAHRQTSRLLQAAAEGILGLRADGCIEFANPAACQLLEANAEQLTGLNAARIFSGLEGSAPIWQHSAAVQAAVQSGLYRESDTEFTTLTGRQLSVAYALSAIAAENASAAPSFVLLFQDISQRKQMEARLKNLAERDPLTGLANRTLFSETFSYILKTADRNNHQVALLYLDLDGFKAVNDTHGHQTGDQLLCEVAERMKVCLRKSDFCARLGGDEFALVLSDCGSSEEVGQVADKIIAAIRQPYSLDGRQVQVGTSVGFAIYPEDAKDHQGLLKIADAAMYQAKRGGGLSFVHGRPDSR